MALLHHWQKHSTDRKYVIKSLLDLNNCFWKYFLYILVFLWGSNANNFSSANILRIIARNNKTTLEPEVSAVLTYS